MNRRQLRRAAERQRELWRMRCRLLQRRQRCDAFGVAGDERPAIGPIYVVSLDREPRRWAAVRRELARIVDGAVRPLSERALRFSACDGQADPDRPLDTYPEIERVYTLADQLAVEPQPHIAPDSVDLARPILLTRTEVAIARSHVALWRTIAAGDAPYAMVLEDDVWFERRFGARLAAAWREMIAADGGAPVFDLLYLSFREVYYGGTKRSFTRHLFRVERGLWHTAGYLLSREGARRLLALLPCRGPVDLWLNLQFPKLEVRALRRSAVTQRPDLPSTNTQSIRLPFGRLGLLNSAQGAFRRRPVHRPVFAFGPAGSGLSSLAMALSLLGYRCCSDVDRLPDGERAALLRGRGARVFDAYVNVGGLREHLGTLLRRHPGAKVIVTAAGDRPAEAAEAQVLVLDRERQGWRRLAAFLGLPPPLPAYPFVAELGQRRLVGLRPERSSAVRRLRHDRSPWIAPRRDGWAGLAEGTDERTAASRPLQEDAAALAPERWLSRTDTFPGNAALFRPANVVPAADGGLRLSVTSEPRGLGIRTLGAAAVAGRAPFLYGRFEAELQASAVPGLVTTLSLLRETPWQEIVLSIAGDRPGRLLLNVFYNPGTEGAEFDYGRRGTPVAVDLGFDASRAPHRFAIDWRPGAIAWLVDDQPVHRRVLWDPTPIPHLPLTAQVSLWPPLSRWLAGRLRAGALPASIPLRRLSVDAGQPDQANSQSTRLSISSTPSQ